jgi:carbonic anhydrase
MKITNFLTLKSLQTMLALLLVVFLGAGLFTACSKADAKKDKSKKSKSQSDEEESEEETASKEKDSEEKDSKESKEKDSAEKKAPDEKKSSEKKVSHEAIWNELMKGNKRFMDGKHTTVNYSAMRVSLAKGQKPEVIVLGCADSRVPPEFVFDKNLGELFVIREAGNIADEVSLGSIEYAIEHLHAKMIVVLGHEACGAVAAAVSGEKMPTKNLTEIVQMIAPAFEDSKGCVIGEKPNMTCVELNADHSAKDLLLKSSVIKKAVEEGEVEIISAVYHFDTGEVVRLK